MKQFRPDVLTLLLAHVIGSYCGYLPTFIYARYLFFRPNDYSNWIFLCIAPVSQPIGLVVRTIADFPHYIYTPHYWASYTIPFVVVCLIRRKKTHILKLVVPPIAVTLFVTAVWLPDAMAALAPWRSPLEGKPAPDFTLTALTGATCSISKEKGHVVLIDFWATNCVPCRVELKQTITKLADDAALLKRGLRVWAIDVWDGEDIARKFVNENQYDLTVMADPGNKATKLYHAEGIPVTYLVGRDGVIRKVFLGVGPETDGQLRAEIDAALK